MRVEILVENKTYRMLPNFVDGIISISMKMTGSRGTLFPRWDRSSELGVSCKAWGSPGDSYDEYRLLRFDVCYKCTDVSEKHCSHLQDPTGSQSSKQLRRFTSSFVSVYAVEWSLVLCSGVSAVSDALCCVVVCPQFRLPTPVCHLFFFPSFFTSCSFILCFLSSSLLWRVPWGCRCDQCWRLIAIGVADSGGCKRCRGYGPLYICITYCSLPWGLELVYSFVPMSVLLSLGSCEYHVNQRSFSLGQIHRKRGTR